MPGFLFSKVVTLMMSRIEGTFELIHFDIYIDNHCESYILCLLKGVQVIPLSINSNSFKHVIKIPSPLKPSCILSNLICKNTSYHGILQHSQILTNICRRVRLKNFAYPNILLNWNTL